MFNNNKQRLKTVYTFATSTEAHIAKSLLESADIPAVIQGENFANLYPIHLLKLNGVQLQVFEKDFEDALSIIKDTFENVITESEFECPYCSSNYVEKIQHCGLVAYLSFFANFIPIPFLKIWKCNSCGKKWY